MKQECQEEKTPLLKANNKSCSDNPKSGFSKILLYITSITVEPIVLLQSLGRGFEGVFLTNIWVDKVCEVQLNYSAEVCHNIDSGDYPEEQDEVQRIVNLYQIYRHWIEYLPATFAVIALGVLSDAKGRRLSLLIPMFGCFLERVGYLINSYVWSLPPAYLILSYVPKGFSGSLLAVTMGVYTYMSDSTGGRSRTSHMGILVFTGTIALPVGRYLSTIIYDRYGYFGVFLCPFTCEALGLIYAIVRLENHPNKHANNGQQSLSFCEIYSLANFKKLFMVLFRRREHLARPKICGNLAAICVTMFSKGSSSDIVLYTRKKFRWNYYEYTLYSIVESPLQCIGSLFVLPFLSYKLSLEDNMLGFISSCAGIISKVIIGTAPYGWVMYIGSIVMVCGRMTFASSRSALSKLVEPNELGAIFSLVAATETITPMVRHNLAIIFEGKLRMFFYIVFFLEFLIKLIEMCLNNWLLEFP
ncbi:unnamed protein product, partial [Meganyctiphanes norvegica]